MVLVWYYFHLLATSMHADDAKCCFPSISWPPSRSTTLDDPLATEKTAHGLKWVNGARGRRLALAVQFHFLTPPLAAGQIGDDRCIVVSKIYAMVKWWFRVRLAPTPPLCIHTTYTKHTNTIIHRKEKKKWSRCQRTCPIDHKRSKQLLAAYIYTKGACLSQSRTHAFQTHPPIYWSYRQVTMPK